MKKEASTQDKGQKTAENFFLYEPDPRQELVKTFLHQKNLRIERIVSFGQSSGIYEQTEDEWFLLLEGEAVLELAREIGPGQPLSRELKLTAGDTLFLPAGQRHRVRWTSRPALWLCVFVPHSPSTF